MEIKLMSEISFMLNMSASDKIAALGATATALTFLIAAITFWWTWRRYRGDQHYQQLRELIVPLKTLCEQYERPLTITLEERAMVNVG
jgi:hypothetical protein